MQRLVKYPLLFEGIMATLSTYECKAKKNDKAERLNESEKEDEMHALGECKEVCSTFLSTVNKTLAKAEDRATMREVNDVLDRAGFSEHETMYSEPQMITSRGLGFSK